MTPLKWASAPGACLIFIVSILRSRSISVCCTSLHKFLHCRHNCHTNFASANPIFSRSACARRVLAEGGARRCAQARSADLADVVTRTLRIRPNPRPVFLLCFLFSTQPQNSMYSGGMQSVVWAADGTTYDCLAMTIYAVKHFQYDHCGCFPRSMPPTMNPPGIGW